MCKICNKQKCCCPVKVITKTGPKGKNGKDGKDSTVPGPPGIGNVVDFKSFKNLVLNGTDPVEMNYTLPTGFTSGNYILQLELEINRTFTAPSINLLTHLVKNANLQTINDNYAHTNRDDGAIILTYTHNALINATAGDIVGFELTSASTASIPNGSITIIKKTTP